MAADFFTGADFLAGVRFVAFFAGAFSAADFFAGADFLAGARLAAPASVPAVAARSKSAGVRQDVITGFMREWICPQV